MSADIAALARSIFCVGFAGSEVAASPIAELGAFAPGGIIVFGRNVGDAGQLRELIAALRACGDIPPLIAVDQEGGRVARVSDPALVAQFPSAMALAAGGDAVACEATGRLVGRDLARLGFSVNFAPCADLALDAQNTVIGTRSFGDDPAAVADRCAAFARGLESGGVAAALKHFPGHGATAADSHLEVPLVTTDLATLRARDLVPFRTAIATGCAALVMTAHIVVEALDAAVPATLSAALLEGLLRSELGFKGVIATDCLEMDAIAATIGTSAGAVAALAAGADLLVVSQHLASAGAAAEAVARAIAAGVVSLERLESAARRVRRLRERYAAPVPFSGELGGQLPLEAARRAVTVVRGDARLAPGKAVTVISFEGQLGGGAADARAQLPSLSAVLRSRRWKSELMRVALEPEAADLELLLAHLPVLGDRNFVLVTRRAHIYPGQLAAVEKILAVIPTAIVICAREPYDAALIGAQNIACIYGDEAISLEGCADVLSGRIRAGGRLPVAIGRESLAAG